MRAALTVIRRHAALVLWYLLVPAVLAALTLRYLLPVAGDPVMEALHDRLLAVGATAFLLFGVLIRYWSRYLPGAAPIEPAPGRDRRKRAAVMIAIALAAIAGVAASRVVRPVHIVGISMVPTIFPGDRVWIDFGAYSDGHEPRRGDVIVFRHDDTADGASGVLAKRVVGIPGDRITMIDSVPVVNGREIPHCDAGTFIYFSASRVSRGRLIVEWLGEQAHLAIYEHGPQAFGAYDVQPGEVFVLGDNRGISNDSRNWPDGRGVALSAIEGRAERVLYGEDRAGRLDWDRVGARLGTSLDLPGIDIRDLRAGIEKCVRTPPSAAITRGGEDDSRFATATNQP